MLSRTVPHLLVHLCSNLLVGHGHVGVCWREHALHQAALPLSVVLLRRRQRQVSEAGEVCVSAVQQVVKALRPLQSTITSLSRILSTADILCSHLTCQTT